MPVTQPWCTAVLCGLQVQGLLADKRTTEALELAQNANHGLPREKFLKVHRKWWKLILVMKYLEIEKLFSDNCQVKLRLALLHSSLFLLLDF